MKDITICHVCHHRIPHDVRTYLVNIGPSIVPVCEGCLTKQYLNDLSHGGLWFCSKVSIGKFYLNNSSVYNAIIYPESLIKQGYQLKTIIAHFLLSTGVFEKMQDCIIAYHDDGDTADWYALEIRKPQGVEPYVMTDHMTILGTSNRLRPKYMIPELLNLGMLNFQHDPGRIGSFIERHNQPYRLSELPCPTLCWKDLLKCASESMVHCYK